MKKSIVLILLLISFAAGANGIANDNAHASATTPEVQSPLAGELVKRQVVASGGVRGSSTNFILSSAIGQAVGGSGASANFKLNSGYWPGQDAATSFHCADADGSGIITISDAVFLINYIFAGGTAPNPVLAGDADCNGIVTISDAVYLINYIFAGGPAPCAACP